MGVRLVTYDRTQRRLWIAHQRIHHGALGVVLVATGLVLTIHDRRDVPFWFRLGDLQARRPLKEREN